VRKPPITSTMPRAAVPLHVCRGAARRGHAAAAALPFRFRRMAAAVILLFAWAGATAAAAPTHPTKIGSERSLVLLRLGSMELQLAARARAVSDSGVASAVTESRIAEPALQILDRGHVLLSQQAPAQAAFAVRGLGGGWTEEIHSSGYDSVTKMSHVHVIANATIVRGAATGEQMQLLVCDRWFAVGAGALARFELNRTMSVISNPNNAVHGMQTRLMLDLASAPLGTRVGQLSAFAPAIWYGNNSGIISGGAIGSDKTLSDYFVRADRFAAPLFSVLAPPAAGSGVRARATLYSLDRGFVRNTSTPPLQRVRREESTIPSLNSEWLPLQETVMADNASAVLVDDRLGYGALGLHQAGPEDSSQQPVQLGYIFPGTEYERTYTQGNHVLRRYHSATIGGISRSSLAVTVAAIAVAEQELLAVENDSAPEADVWGLIKAAWVRFMFSCCVPAVLT
jgi:hypothetical protein